MILDPRKPGLKECYFALENGKLSKLFVYINVKGKKTIDQLTL